MYSVAEGVRVMLGSNLLLDFDWVKVVWNKYVPSKMAIFHWLSIHGGVPVKEVLRYRHCLRDGMDDKCSKCTVSVESIQHLLLHCPWAFKVWLALFEWWNVSWVMPFDISPFSLECYNGLGVKAKKAWRLIGPAVYWFIWLARNDLVFNGVSKCWTVIVDSVKLKVFQWLVNARKTESLQFYIWKSQPWDVI
ncbi:uncharacterized protein [Rutidosis leptorrhynchoides]|uniref:uncharacterized protein n=1 Tax=Rutidosis leptorrhynchoides TaxID=125765 RepID=UPI003A999960